MTLGQFFEQVFEWLRVLIGLAIVVYVGIWIFTTPKNDRVWLPEQDRLASATVNEDTVTLHNVRNWTYNKDTITSTSWEDVTVHPHDIVRAWFLIEPFADIQAIGHTFLSFEFKDGTTLAFSVEARREADEKYSALRGLTPAYELAYQWGTERDFVTRRINYLGHPVRMYPLLLPEGGASALFSSLIEETNALAVKPRFYNTLFENCTNVLAHLVNKHYPHTLPYDISWQLTGLSDVYLMKQAFVGIESTIEETKSHHDLTVARDTIQTHATDSPKAFSSYIRTLLPH